MNRFLFATTLMAICASVPANARTLHYGDTSIELTGTKHTSPALHIQFGDGEMAYGALYTSSAPNNAIHIAYADKEYWLGPWCERGTYLPRGATRCAECNMEHYGIGADLPTDARNKILTLAQVDNYLPETELSEWELIDECNIQICFNADAHNDPKCGCATGSLTPGTYLVVHIYRTISNLHTEMYVFDHTVGYKIQHSAAFYGALIDTENPTFQSWTQKSPAYQGGPLIQSNVSGIEDLEPSIYIYKHICSDLVFNEQ